MSLIDRLSSKFYGPEFISPIQHFNSLIRSFLNSSSCVLHAGCGVDESIGLHAIAGHTVGLDYLSYLSANHDLDDAVVGDLECVPFKAASFDLVVSRWVIEHLSDPFRFFQESSRVLRPGGKLVILTPNVYYYAVVITRLSPLSFQKWFVKNILHENPDGVFKTFYRSNTRSQLSAHAKKAGLTQQYSVILEGKPSLLAFSKLSFLIGILYERLINSSDIFSIFRSTIISVFLKDIA